MEGDRVEVPGGEMGYVEETGALKYTGPHSAFMPPGSIVGGFTARNVTHRRKNPQTLLNWEDEKTECGKLGSLSSYYMLLRSDNHRRGDICLSNGSALRQGNASAICWNTKVQSNRLYYVKRASGASAAQQ